MDIITNGTFQLSGGGDKAPHLVDSRSGARISSSAVVLVSADEMAGLLHAHMQAGAEAGARAGANVGAELLSAAVLAARR